MRRALLLLPLAAVLAACGNEDPGNQTFVSRPDLKPPTISITKSGEPAPGYIFIAPKTDAVQAGPLILDNDGNVVWFRPLDIQGIADFRTQTLDGKPVLTWWRGKAPMGIGEGYDVILDDSYVQTGTVVAPGDLVADVHEFLLTGRSTALIPIYRKVSTGKGEVWEGIVEELELPSGKVLFEWHSYPEIGTDESYTPAPKTGPWDYFHLNSIQEDADGNLLISARNTQAVYKLDRATKSITWRLGGKKSDFEMGTGTKFAWQHDARWRSPDTISLFDNSADPPTAKHSRAILLRVDQQAMTAELVKQWVHPDGILSGSQGNAEFLPGGHVLVGWGANPNFTEFDADGKVVLDGSFKSKDADSYRAYKLDWVGNPDRPPDLAVRTVNPYGDLTAYVSWNGATGVTGWRVLAGPSERELREVATARKTGFETAIDLGRLGDTVYVVEAIGRKGRSAPVSASPF